MAKAIQTESFVRPPANRLTGRVAPCEKRLQRHREVLDGIARSKGEKAYYRALGELAQRDYWLFLRDVLLYEWLDPWFHGEEVCTFLAQTEGSTRAILMPRGSGKSSMVTVPMPAWRLARDPMCRVMVCNATEPKASQFCRASAQIIANHPRYKKCYPYLVPSDKWGEGGYYVDISAFDKSQGSVERIDASLKSWGITSNVTGAHVNGETIFDDLINREISRSPTQLRRVEDFYSEALNCTDAGTTVTICGTRWVYGDYYGKLISGDLGGNEGPVNILKLGYLRKNEHGHNELIWPQKTFIDLATGKPNTAGYTWEKIKEQKKNLGALFSALYENEPVVDEDRKFDLDLIKKFKEIPFETGAIASVYIEVESQAQALYDGVRRCMQQEGRVFRLERVTSKKVSKRERILSTLQPLIADVRFNMPLRLWEGGDNIGEELRTYDKGKDDCLDACSYVAALAKENKEGAPRVYIAVDPAFSVDSYSDYTAIAAGCVVDGEFYLLDLLRFQTDRVDVIARQIFRMYDKFHKRATNRPKRFDLNIQGHRSGNVSHQPYFVSGEEPFVAFDESTYFITGDETWPGKFNT